MGILLSKAALGEDLNGTEGSVLGDGRLTLPPLLCSWSKVLNRHDKGNPKAFCCNKTAGHHDAGGGRGGCCHRSPVLLGSVVYWPHTMVHLRQRAKYAPLKILAGQTTEVTQASEPCHAQEGSACTYTMSLANMKWGKQSIKT